jgi:hypothetical protein
MRSRFFSSLSLLAVALTFAAAPQVRADSVELTLEENAFNTYSVNNRYALDQAIRDIQYGVSSYYRGNENTVYQYLTRAKQTLQSQSYYDVDLRNAQAHLDQAISIVLRGGYGDEYQTRYQLQSLGQNAIYAIQRSVTYRNGGYPNPNPPYPPNPYPPYPGQTVSLTCESWNHAYANCAVGGYIQSVQLQYQRSRESCIYGSTWGYSANTVWVSGGCRATFLVSLRRY